MYNLHNYDIVEDSGFWYISVDGEPARNVMYRYQAEARSVADRLTTVNRLWHGIYGIEVNIDYTMADNGRTWPYGATCLNHGTDTNPDWVLTEPYRDDDESKVRHVNPAPTGYVQINVYDRTLYEEACATIGITPKSDDEIRSNTNAIHSEFIADDSAPIDAVTSRVDYRRAVGIQIEDQIEVERRFEVLKKAGLTTINRFGRDQYIVACEIMGVEPQPDDTLMAMVALDIASEFGFRVISEETTTDAVSIGLAYRRSLGYAEEQRAKTTEEAVNGPADTDSADTTGGGK